MEHPTASEHHQRLHAMTGTWQGRETLLPSPWMPDGGTAEAIVESRVDLGGLFVVSNYRQRRADEVTFRGHGVYGYDADEGCYTMYWFDSMTPGGFVTPARGTWDGNTLTFISHRPDSHGRYTYVFGKDEYRFTLEGSPDGETWNVMMESTLVRRE